jgi:uncharacterized membrane protein YqjE
MLMAVPQMQNGRSMAEVLQDIVANIQEIFRSEFRLAKVEIQQQAAVATRSAVPLIIGLLLGLYALGFLLLAAVRALSIVVDPWLASLIVGAAALAISLALVSVGKNRLKLLKVVPEKTVESVKENMQWAKQQIR